MARFLLCSFALVLLYPTGIDMYLVGLPRIAQDLAASEAQLHIAFSVYLAGMAAAMLLAGRAADKAGRQPVTICGAIIFALGSVLCANASDSTLFLSGRFIQGVGAGSCYVTAFAIMRDTLDDQRRAKVLSFINGITCIVPVLAPVLGNLIMMYFPWQSLFWVMCGMGILVLLLSTFVLKETHPGAQTETRPALSLAAETLANRFFISRVAMTTLCVTTILTFVNVSPVLMMEVMQFTRSEYSTIMALTALVSMAVAFSTPFLLSLFRQRPLILMAQGLFLLAAVVLTFATSHSTTLLGLTLICGGFSLGFGVKMSQALGPFSRRAGVASSVLGIAQVCGSSLYIWLAAMLGVGALNMLIGILISCSMVCILLILFVDSTATARAP